MERITDRKRVLVVDDEPQIGELISEALSNEFDVVTARSGEEAIRRAVLEHPNCILMDVMMPQMGGFMLCEILKSIKQTRLIPILIVSAKPRQEVWSMAQEMGALDYIEKPFTISAIADAVHRAMTVAPVERRRTPRVKMKLPILLRGKDAQGREFEIHSETEDVSRFGALVRLPVRIHVGEVVELQQDSFPGVHMEAIKTRARVVWNDSEGTIGPYRHGLEFLEATGSWVIKN